MSVLQIAPLCLVFLVTASAFAGETKTGFSRSERWPVSLDEAKGASFEDAGLKPLGGVRLQDGVVSISASGDGVEVSPGGLERFVMEMDLDKPAVSQSLELRFLDEANAALFRIRLQGGGRLDINGTAWVPKDSSPEVRSRYLFAVDQKARRVCVLVQYANVSKMEKAFDESELVTYQASVPIAKVQVLADGDGAMTIRELNVFRPDIAAIGDSTCQGGNAYSPIPTLTQEARSWSFEYNLEKLIDPPARVTNLGFSGHRLSAMKRHVERAEKLGARVCVAIIGVNSISLKSLTDEEVQNQYREWVEYAVAKGLKPVCCTMFPKSYGKDEAAQGQYNMLNDWIRKTVPSLGGEVIELHDQMVSGDGVTTPRELTSDGHHPNGAGYRKAAGIMRPALDHSLKLIQ